MRRPAAAAVVLLASALLPLWLLSWLIDAAAVAAIIYAGLLCGDRMAALAYWHAGRLIARREKKADG